MFKTLKAVIEGLFTLQGLYSLVTAPTVSAAVVAVAGYLGGVPVMWILTAAAVVFASVATGILRWNEFSARVSPVGKLEFMDLGLGLDANWNARGVPTYVSGINVGFILRNRATFPLNYKIVSFNGQACGLAANADAIVGKVAIIQALSGTIAASALVDLKKIKPLNVLGTLEVEIHYGTGDDLSNVIKVKKEFDVVVHPKSSQKPNLQIGIASRDKL